MTVPVHLTVPKPTPLATHTALRNYVNALRRQVREPAFASGFAVAKGDRPTSRPRLVVAEFSTACEKGVACERNKPQLNWQLAG